MKYHVIEVGLGLWTVGYKDYRGLWRLPDKYDSLTEALDRATELNGGTPQAPHKHRKAVKDEQESE